MSEVTVDNQVVISEKYKKAYEDLKKLLENIEIRDLNRLIKV